MKIINICLLVILFSFSFAQGQSKKDLIAELDQLKQELKSTKSELNESRKNERINITRLQSMETQMADLKENNAGLLANMGGFTKLSQQKSKNLEESLKTIKIKDGQLKMINEELTSGDSTKLATLTIFKNGLGSSLDQEVKLAIKQGAVYLTMTNDFLFGSDKSTSVTDGAKGTLGKIANVLNSKPDLDIVVEGNSNALNFPNNATDNWDLSSLQAAAVARVLQTEHTVDPKRMKVLGLGEYGSQSIETATRIMISPKFDEFYSMVKESMKNGGKEETTPVPVPAVPTSME